MSRVSFFFGDVGLTTEQSVRAASLVEDAMHDAIATSLDEFETCELHK